MNFGGSMRWTSVGGKFCIGWLKFVPNERWVIEEGILLIDLSKLQPKEIVARVRGRLSTGKLKASPKYK